MLTLLSFFAWFISYFADLWLLSLLPLEWLRYPLGLVVAVLALLFAVAPTRLLCAPLRPLFLAGRAQMEAFDERHHVPLTSRADRLEPVV